MIFLLYVDDELPLLDIGKLYLERTGEFMVDTAPSAEIALEKLKTIRYDAIVSDFQMPGMDGIEFLQAVRSTHPTIPFIIFTGKGQEDIFIEAFEKGADSYLQKGPELQFTDLKNKIQQVIQRQNTEKALRESEEKFREIFDQVNDAIHLHEVQENGLPGRFVEVNDVACRMLLYSREELLRKGPLDFVTGYHSPPLEDIVHDLTTKGSAIFETEHQRKDGTIVPVEINARRVHLLGKDLILSIVRDITDRKRSELEIEHLASFPGTNPNPILELDARGTIRYANVAAKETMQQIFGTDDCSAFIPGDIGTLLRELSEGMDAAYLREVSIGDKIFMETVHLHAKFNVIRVYSQDITERKRAEEALFLSNKKINLLSSITRHDIINQLMALNGYIDLSRDSLEDQKTLRTYLEKMEKVSTTIERQIRFTKDYQDLGASAPEWQNVQATIENAETELHMRNISVGIDATDLEIFADPLLEKVFYNLIDNALRYGGEQMTTIHISSQKSGPGLTIVCEDDGVGISDKDRQYLFTRGFGKNTGLGLFLSREILGITGMTIKETGTSGKGARFEIEVPKGASRFSGT